MTDREAIDTLQSMRLIKQLTYDKAEVLLHADTRSAFMRHRAALKEPWTVAWIERCMGSGEVFYDVGANTGVYSILASRLHSPDFKVVAFEPAFANFADLCSNLFLNDCMSRSIALPVALAEKPGLIEFGFRNLEAGAAMHGQGFNVGKPGETAIELASVWRILWLAAAEQVLPSMDSYGKAALTLRGSSTGPMTRARLRKAGMGSTREIPGQSPPAFSTADRLSRSSQTSLRL